MLARMLRRAPLFLVLALSAASCEDKSSSAPVPTPDVPAAAPKEAASMEAKLAPPPTTAEALATAKETAPPVETASALAAAPPASADAKTSKAPADAKADAKAAGGDRTALPAGLPKTKNGILPPGAADKILAVGARPLVKLIENGAEPRAELVYDLEKGTKHSLGMNMDMVMSLKMGLQQVPQVIIPRMLLGLDMTAGDKDASGDWKIDALLQRVGLEPKGATQQEMAKQMRPHIDGMKGLTMSYFVTPKGHVHDVKINTPPNFPAQAQQMLTGMNQSFESMVAPLPGEPVGIGARWEVTTRIASSGADLLQLATYTLRERKGTRATLDISVAQVAAKETINAPGMPAGATAKLSSFHSSGSGSNQLDTKSVAPVGGRMSVSSGMDLEVSVGGAGPAQETNVETKLDVEFTRPAKN